MFKRMTQCSKLIFLLVTVLSQPAFAVGSGGFENATFSGASIGQSNAVVAQADEAAAISYNPAGIAYLPGIQAQTTAAFFSIFTNRHTANDHNQISAGTISVVPTGYLTMNPGHYLGDRVSFGVGSDSPFGLANKYDSNQSHVHYAGWRNYLKMYTIKPVAAVKISEKLSIGGGPIYYRIFDFGGIQAYPNAAAFGAGTPDGQVRLNLSGNTWGWHLGMLAKPIEKHQFGFYFRSPTTVHTRGQIKVENSTATGKFETGGKAKIDLPLNFTFAYAYKPTPKWTVESDLGFTRWSAHKRLYIDADPVSTADDAILRAIGKTDKDYSDGWSLHLGGNYKPSSKLTLRAGGLFYWAVVPNDHFIPAVPDSNSIGGSLGAGYKISKNFGVDVAYLSRFWLRRKIDNSISESLGTSVDGRYSSILHEFLITFNYAFGASDKENDVTVDKSVKTSN